MNEDIAKEAGLILAGKNEEGDYEYIGTREQWEMYDELETKYEEMTDLEIKSIKEHDR